MKRWAKEWADEHKNVSKLSPSLALKMDLKSHGQVTATSRRRNIHTEKEAQRLEDQAKRDADEKRVRTSDGAKENGYAAEPAAASCKNDADAIRSRTW